MRTKTFEAPVVLDKAMLVFWQQGYENTSMQNLVDAMGIHRRSIYDTFGDKHELFIQVLAHYRDQINERFDQVLATHTDLRSRLTAIFEIFIDHPDNQPAGCLVVNTAATLNSLEPDIQTLIQHYLTQEKALLQALLIAGQAELEPSVAIDLLAASLQSALIGIRVMAKVNPDSTTLTAIVQQTLQTLPWKEVF